MSRRAAIFKTWSATGGAMLVAGVICMALVAALPLVPEDAFAIGGHLFIPLWAACACVLPLVVPHR